MKITRTTDVGRARFDADHVVLSVLPSGRWAWTGSLVAEHTHGGLRTACRSKLSFADVGEAEADAVEWAQAGGVRELLIITGR